MMLRNPDLAEEVTQDSFIRAFTHLDLYDESRPFYPWLATIAVRLTRNRQRQLSLELKRQESLDESDQEHAGKDTPDRTLAEKEAARQLWDRVSTLPLGERTVVFLFYRQELKVSEIARVLGVTGGTVKTLLFRARKKLRTDPTIRNISGAYGEEP